MIDVSYRYKKGIWMMDEETSEVHEVVPEPQPEPQPQPEPAPEPAPKHKAKK
jgi:hypothetical protein